MEENEINQMQENDSNEQFYDNGDYNINQENNEYLIYNRGDESFSNEKHYYTPVNELSGMEISNSMYEGHLNPIDNFQKNRISNNFKRFTYNIKNDNQNKYSNNSMPIHIIENDNFLNRNTFLNKSQEYYSYFPNNKINNYKIFNRSQLYNGNTTDEGDSYINPNRDSSYYNNLNQNRKMYFEPQMNYNLKEKDINNGDYSDEEQLIIYPERKYIFSNEQYFNKKNNEGILKPKNLETYEVKSIEYIPDEDYNNKSSSLYDYILKSESKNKLKKNKSCNNITYIKSGNKSKTKYNIKTDLNIITPKILSIKMTKDIMNEIYNSKTIYDQKCYENKIPRETLEQHMYTYLNQKYGLKNLTIEWASSIINAIKIYSNEDCDINLFGKILRNEQEEDSRLVIENLKSNISELLEYYLRSKNPFKSKTDIKKMLDNKKEGYLNEEEWKGIINYIYSPEDAEAIQSKIINFIQIQNEKVTGPLSLYAQTGVGPTEIFNSTSSNNVLNNLSTFGNLSNANFNLNSNSNNNFNNLNNVNSMNYLLSYHGSTRKLSREELFNLSKLKEELNIQYKDFLKLLCVYQIKNRDKYLKNFVKLFRKYDTDLDGILNENEFVGLIKDIPCCKDNADEYAFKFLTIIDPFNNKKITFSECISLFSMEIMEEPYNDENNKENDDKNNNAINEQNNGNNNDANNENKNNNNNINNNNPISLLDKICLEC